MGFELREGSVSLFKNNKKTNDRAPDWRGEGLFNGEKIKISGWQKQTSKGEMFISMKVEKDAYKPQTRNVEKPKQQSFAGSDLEDDIPFSPLRGTQIASY